MDDPPWEGLSECQASHWCYSCPQFLRDTLAVVSDNTWICQLSLEMCKQLPCYNETPQEKVTGRGVPQQEVTGGEDTLGGGDREGVPRKR